MPKRYSRRKHKRPRVLTLVRPTHVLIGMLGKKKPAYFRDLPLVYMGEIKNMPEHGVFVSMKSGRIYPGYHIWDFEEIPDDET
jgi:hypothetical protein